VRTLVVDPGIVGRAHTACGRRSDHASDRAGVLGARGNHRQRISRAKRTVAGVRFNQPGDVATVVRVLYLVFNEGYSGDVDLAAEAIRLTRQLATMTNHEEVAGLLALMLLHHARRPARTRADGSLVPLAEQDRSLWDTHLIAEGVDVLQTALARDRLGEFQAQAAIAALHADAQTAEETDWVQIVEWYDELVRLTDNPVARLHTQLRD
jgi:predicted RNA polymerase sigma factor